jgi:putative nucleotidyltransferase with HDIG domain
MLTGSQLKPKFSFPSWTSVLLAGGACAMTAALIAFPYLPHNVHLKEEVIAHKTIVSNRYIELETTEDKAKSHLNLLQHRTGGHRVFSVNTELSSTILDTVKGIFEDIKLMRENGVSNNNMASTLSFLSPHHQEALLRMPLKSVLTLQYFTIQHADIVLTQGVHAVDTGTIENLIDSSVEIWQLDKIQREIATQILLHTLKPNLVFDASKTRFLSQNQGAHKPYITIIKEGQPIIYKGEVVTLRHLEILKALDMVGVKANWGQILGIVILVILLLAMLERFVFYFNPRIHANRKNLILVYVLMMFGLFTAILIRYIGPLPYQLDLRFLIPISISAMMTSLMLRTNISMLAGTVLSVLIAMLYKADFALLVYLFLGNSFTLFIAYKRYSRKELISAGYWVGLFNMVSVIGLGFFNEVPMGVWYISNAAVALMNGILASMISLAILPYFESIFNITTRQTLLEFSNLSHPLLQQLMVSAPGTYQHSLMVATLAEAAAERVKADPVLCRVGAYFHDIGKLKRPQFFSENQLSGENPHLNLTPRMSKTIIASHVKEGLELAAKYKLPDEIKQIIAQHHGTTMVSFFFIQAIHQSASKDIDQVKEDFRYPGPKPQSKEAAIVMLADSVEAATRALEKPTFSKVENLVEKIFRDKIDDGQLSEAPISLNEIKEIKSLFLRILKGIYHSRLDYQEELDKLLHQNQDKKS